jgi:hypothetical protein
MIGQAADMDGDYFSTPLHGQYPVTLIPPEPFAEQ